MKRLYALVIALLMLCAGCNVKTTPEPQTIPPIETPMQQGGSATTAPDENVPIPPAAPSIYAQQGKCRNHAAFHYLKDN